jgi:beta-lactam-binding protein with PASTA domain
MVPGAGDEAYINPLPEQGPVVDQFFTVANIRGPRHDSDSNQSMYVVHGGLTVSGSWEFGDNGTGTSVIYLANDAEVSVNGEMRHRQGGAELYISDSVVFTCSDWLRLADSGSALVDINGEPNVMIAGDLRGASNSGAWFEAYIGGGQVSVGGDLKIGDYGGGLIDISGGEVSCGHLRLVAGAAGTTADLNVGDGELYVANSTTVCEGSGIASLNMSAGDVNTGHLLIGGDGGVGSVDMSGGTLVVRSVLRVPASPGGTATVDLDGGTILCGSFESAGAYTMELNQGVLVIDGNVIEAILADVNAGYITAHPDKNDVVVDYNGVRTGRTTVWSVPHLKIVPDVVSEERAEAELAITDIFLVVGTVVEEYNDIVAAGEVIRQNPAVGTAVAFGSVVDLVVSLGQPNVPNVVGMTSTDAIDAVTAVDDLTVAAVSWTYDNAVPAGLVISQDPLGGTAVPIGSAVDLVVSLGKPLVPDVVGMPEPNAAIAIELIDNLGVGTVSQAYHDTVPAGSVISQEPLAGTLVPIGSSVDLVVSLGRPIVPNVVGMTQGAATSLIEAVSLTVGTVNLEYSDTIAAGIVIIQHPVGGTPALVGYGVTLTVSLGKPVAPMVVGQSLADATLAIEGIDELTVGSVTEVYDDAVPAGVVISQDPVGGTVVLIGSTVDLVVSLGRPIVPDVVGQTEAAAIVAIEAVDDLTALVTREYHNTVPLGDVASQDPAPGTAVNIGSIVNIVVSLGRPVVPDVVGLDEADAVSQIDAIEGLTAAVARQYHNTVPAGIVISQEPAGGTDVDVGTTVDIVVSSGRPVVPNVVGMDAADANTAIEAIDDLTAAVTYQYHNTAAVGTVSSQDPVGGSEVDVASTVAIVVSLGRPVVPDVVGLTQTAAVVAIGAIDDLVPVLSYAYDNTAPAGEVISQDPAGGTSVDVGSSVDVMVSLGRPLVPDVVGLTKTAAVVAIAAIDDLVPVVSYAYDNVVAPDYVISQEPVGGTSVDVGAAVEILVSLGRPLVPDVVGLSEAAAVAAVEAVNSLVAVVSREYHNSVPAGQVSSQDPVAETPVDIGSTVTVVVSLGRPVVPNVVGHSELDAVTAIEAVDHLVVSSIHEHDNSVPPGIVISQNPMAGMEVEVGSTVTIVISMGRPVVPNVVGLSEAAAILAVESIDSLVVSVVYAHHDTVAAGVVIGQDPTGGATVNVGTIVTIGVSLGRPFVPDVVGMSQAEAAIAIGVIDGLSVSAQFEYDGAVPEGIVIDQDPAAGTVMDVGSTVTIVVSLGPTTFMVLGGVRLVELQNADGGWDEPLDDGDPEDGSEPYRFTSVALGLILSQRLNRQSNNSELTAAIERAGSFLISKVYTFAPGDGLLAVELDRVLGGTEYTSYVRSNFYDQLSAGTYADARSGVFDCNTAKYIQAQRDRLTGSSANFAAWELGLGLYSAYVMEQDTSEWVAGVKAEIDELNVFGSNDVLGLAGAVLGLAVVGEEYDPQAGEHAGASDLSDLAAILSGYQLGTGGFTWHAGFVVEGWDESVRETAYGLMALNEFDRAGYLSVINAAGEYLESVQLASNGWEHFFGGEEDNEATGEALMGAVSAHALAGDFNNDGNEDLGDFSVFASAWMSEVGDSNYKSICDMAKPTDGIVDGQDLAVLGGLWLQGAE